MARPRNKARTVRVDLVLSLRPGRDDDLIRFFASMRGNVRVEAVKAALRGQRQTEDGGQETEEREDFSDLAF